MRGIVRMVVLGVVLMTMIDMDGASNIDDGQQREDECLQ
jgi:hypothetical protein